jgi:AMP nucleosidase
VKSNCLDRRAPFISAVGEHLQIGLTALDIPRGQLGTLHSCKLRSFDEPPFR